MWRGIFEELSQDKGRAELAENLCASPFIKRLLIETSFSNICISIDRIFKLILKCHFLRTGAFLRILDN